MEVIENPTSAPTEAEVDVWSWTSTSPDALAVEAVVAMRRTVLGNAAARKNLESKVVALDAKPDDGTAALHSGLGWWMAGNYGKAKQYLDGNHTGPGANFAFADCTFFAGQLGLEGVSSEPGDAADLLLADGAKGDNERNLALRALIAAGRLDEAREFHAGQNEDYKNSAHGRHFEGYLAELENDYSTADAAYQKAIELDPEHQLTLFRLARWFDFSTEDDKAIEYYERLAKTSPPHINALVNLGILYEDQEKFRDAAWCYRRVLSIHPQHPRARMYLKDVEASFHMYYDEDHEVRQDRKNQILKIPVSDFELSVRSRNCLAKMNIVTLSDLVEKTEAELLSYKNFGETSLNEIKQILDMKGLRLGMRPEDEIQPVVPATGGAAPTIPAAAPTTYNIDPSDERLQRSVAEMNLSVRARKCLSSLNIKVIYDLVKYTSDDLLGQRNFGVTSLKEIIEQLEIMGLTLRTVDR